MNYWIIIDEQQAGPYTIEQLAAMNLHPGTPVWREGLPSWIPASQLVELADILRPIQPTYDSLYTQPVESYVNPNSLAGIDAGQCETAASVTDNNTSHLVYVPSDDIPAGYVPALPTGEPKCPPVYLVWSILATVLFFLPLGVCAIICSSKVKTHYREGRFEQAYKMSERTALFIILSIVVAMIWAPFQIVISMI